MFLTRILPVWFLSVSLLISTLGIIPVPSASAGHDPTDFFLRATASGWNSTTTSLCSPSGTAICNPFVDEFRGVAFTVTIEGVDGSRQVPITHDFAIYPKDYGGYPFPGSSAALARSLEVQLRDQATLSFTPTLPRDDFTGQSGYEFFCEYHPDTMQGKIILSKSPDLNGDGAVTIVDIATIASAFGSMSTSANWNIAADIDNDGDVDILDVAKAAFYFGKTLID